MGGVLMTLNYRLIGTRIKNLRLSKSLTQEALAEMSSISPQHVSHVENGSTKLSLPCLVNICNALGVTTDKILCDSITQAEIHLLDDVGRVFSDCDKNEIFLMLTVAENIKKALRIKNNSM
jgi:transcriptional regulator with XRE-family HTH domain